MKGHIRERGAGNWYAVVDRRDAAGKRKRQWIKLDAKNKRQAETECAGVITELQGGTLLEPNKITVAEYAERWLEHVKPNVSPRTHERYAEIVRKNIVPLIGAVVLAKLQSMQISDAYARALSTGRRNGKGGLSPRTVHHMHRLVKQMLGQAVKWQVLNRNPADAVDPPKVERKPLDTYDMAQTVEALTLAKPYRVYIAALLAGLCGLRRGEAAALRWKNVNLDAATLAVVQSAEQTKAGVRYKEPKSGRARNVALPAFVAEELRAWRARQAQELLRLGIRLDGETFVCAREDGEPLQPNSITHAWDQFISGTTLPRLRFHGLRHAHATHMLASGVHPKVASERLGHSKVGITLDLYSHVMPGMQEDAVSRVETAFRAAMRKER